MRTSRPIRYGRRYSPAIEPVQRWLQEKQPDVLFFIYNDHVTSFFFDHYSHFALGVGEEYAVADEGGGPRNLPPVRGHPALARHIATALSADEFDLAYFQAKPLDHGCFSPLSMLWPHEGSWPGAIVPLQVGVLEFPIPTARRCFKLGKSLRRAIESYPEDLKVAIVATGGLAHQVHGERAGFNNTPWDMEFLELLEKQPQRLSELSIAQYAERGGLEGAEVIMWLIMRGALSAKVRKLHSAYYLPSMTPIVTVIYEDDSPVELTETDAAFRARIAHELEGVERLPGTYPFTLERSVKAYRLNHFLHQLIEPQYRRRFLADPEPMFEAAQLTAQERDLRAAARLARADPLRGDLLSPGETGRRRGHHQPARLCRHARPEPRGLPEDPQRPGAVLGRRAGRTAKTVNTSEELQR